LYGNAESVSSRFFHHYGVDKNSSGWKYSNPTCVMHSHGGWVRF
jgi:hypothetical protein